MAPEVVGGFSMAAAEIGEGSSNKYHAAAFHGMIDVFINSAKTTVTLTEVNATDSLGRTPLILAVKKGFSHCVEALITIGAQMNMPDASTGFSPLMLAASLGQLGMCAVLLRRGADLHQICDARSPHHSFTPVHLAEEAEHWQVRTGAFSIARSCIAPPMGSVLELLSHALGPHR